MKRAWYEFLKKDFVQGFPAYCGFEVTGAGDGFFQTRLSVENRHCQQDGFVHAGVLATMCDHTAGYAAYTTVEEGMRILSVEFKINFFRPATGTRVICRASVLKRGRKIVVAESDAFSVNHGEEKQVAKAMVTLMAVPKADLK